MNSNASKPEFETPRSGSPSTESTCRRAASKEDVKSTNVQHTLRLRRHQQRTASPCEEHLAAFDGNLVMLRKFDLRDVVDKFGTSPLQYALFGGSLEAAQYCEKNNGGTLTDCNSLQQSALLCALLGGSVDCVTYILGKCHSSKRCMKSAALFAASAGSVPLLEFCAEHGVDFSYTDSCGTTATHYAAWSGNIDAINFCVLHGGGALDAKTENGDTVLMYAARGGSIRAMKYCVSNGGGLWTDVDNSGNDVTRAAIASDDPKAIEFVAGHIAGSFSRRNTLGESVLWTSASFGTLESFKYCLLRCSDDIVDQDSALGISNDASSVYQAAVIAGNSALVDFLEDHGFADI